MKLEDLGLNTCSHDLFPSSRKFPSVEKLEPQSLPNLPFLDVNLGYKIGTDPPIKPHGSGSFRIKIVEPLTIHTPPSSHVNILQELTNGDLRAGIFEEIIFFFTDPRDGVRINPDGVARPATGKFDFI
ncbi:hypothetical protein Tco_1137334 [Tanacetum coccineum]